MVSYSANLPSIVEEGMEFSLVPPRIDLPRKLHLSYFQEVNFHSAQVEFDEIDSIDDAERALGAHLLVEQTAEIERRLMDAAGIIGFEVVDSALGPLGTVSDIVENGAQQVLVIVSDRAEGRGDQMLLPFVDEFVDGIDDGVVHVTSPKGLFEL